MKGGMRKAKSPLKIEEPESQWVDTEVQGDIALMLGSDDEFPSPIPSKKQDLNTTPIVLDTPDHEIAKSNGFSTDSSSNRRRRLHFGGGSSSFSGQPRDDMAWLQPIVHEMLRVLFPNYKPKDAV